MEHTFCLYFPHSNCVGEELFTYTRVIQKQIQPFCLLLVQQPMHSYPSLGNYPQRELKVSTFLGLVTCLSSLVISSCLQTDIPQKEYVQGVHNSSTCAYTNSFITPIFLLGIHFCWFVFDLGAIIKMPNRTTCRLLHIETRKDNSMKRFS